MNSIQLTIPASSKENSIVTISEKLKPIPEEQQAKVKGGGNPWIDAS